MITEYRVIFTATFDNKEDRNATYDRLKAFMSQTREKFATKELTAGTWKRADITGDEYPIQEEFKTEQV